jgi:hypothetical protein
MSDGLLENIIQLEKSIQTEVDREQLRAEEWQSREMANLETVLAGAKEEMAQHRSQRLAKTKSELEREGTKLQAEAEAWCKRLESLDDSVLRAILRSHLAVILPEDDHDHPHGEG